RFAGAVVVRKDAHDLPDSMTEAHVRADRQVRVPRGELAAHDHLRGTMLRPSAADHLHVPMHPEGHWPYPAQKREPYFRSRRIRGGVKAGHHLGGDQGGSIGISDNLWTASYDQVLLARDIAGGLRVGSAAGDYPVTPDRGLHHGAADSRDE